MSVNVNTSLQARMWRGYDDPGLPAAAYIAHNVNVGDATGGNNAITFIFKLGGEPSSGRFYNIEQMSAFLTTSGTFSVSIQVDRFDRLGPFLIQQRRWRSEIQPDGDGHAAMHYQQGNPPMPLFLGQVSRLAADLTRVTVETDNIDLSVWSVTLQGYIWEPRSIQSEGGLRRPVDSLYGR